MHASSVHLDLLLKVMKVADVFEFTLTKTGERPVDMVSVDGKKYKLTTAELTANFTTLQGKPIKIISLTKNKQYLAAKLQSTPCYAVKVPRGSNKQIEMPDGQIVGPGKVIVINANQLVVNGDTADISTGTVMSEAFFRKTCVLKEISETLRKQLVAAGKLRDENITPMQTPTETVAPVSTPQTPVQTPIQPPVSTPAQSTASQAQLGQIVNVKKYAGTDEIAGYTVLINGEYLPFDVQNTIIACSEGLISNATAVTNSGTGKKFLRGVGIRLEDLPVEYV